MMRGETLGWIGIVMLALVGIAGSSAARADELVLKDGRTLQGKVVRENESSVAFDVSKTGSGLVITYQRSEIEKLTYSSAVKPPDTTSKTNPPAKVETPTVTPAAKRDGPAYFVVPMQGEVGLYATDAFLQKALTLARNEKAQVVILDINSPGGLVQELDKMIDTLLKASDLRIVAYVHDAHSCAAILAMACKEIIMAPGGSIGGAVVFRMTPFGTPQNIEEKMQSIYRAKFRSSTETAGHEPLLIEGMMRTDIHLVVRQEGGKPKVSEGNPIAGNPPGVTTIKPMGKIMTLTSKEAVDAGLALGVAERVEACNKFLTMPKWCSAGESGQTAFKLWKEEVDAAAKKYKAAITSAKSFSEKAAAADPSQFTYEVGRGGEFSPASKRQWQDRTDACAQLLSQVEAQIKVAQGIVTKSPEIRFHADLAHQDYSSEQLASIAERIKAVRERIVANRNKMGIGR